MRGRSKPTKCKCVLRPRTYRNVWMGWEMMEGTAVFFLKLPQIISWNIAHYVSKKFDLSSTILLLCLRSLLAKKQDALMRQRGWEWDWIGSGKIRLPRRWEYHHLVCSPWNWPAYSHLSSNALLTFKITNLEVDAPEDHCSAFTVRCPQRLGCNLVHGAFPAPCLRRPDHLQVQHVQRGCKRGSSDVHLMK